jgi:hypothetical protein
MERLTRRIEERLRTNKVCRVFANELDRVWPPSTKEQAERYERLKQIREYADSRGWSVVVRDAGPQATFRRSA